MDGAVAGPVPHLRRGSRRQVTGDVHNGPPPAGADTDPEIVAAQRRHARRAALLLGFVALVIYIGFIVATGLRH